MRKYAVIAAAIAVFLLLLLVQVIYLSHNLNHQSHDSPHRHVSDFSGPQTIRNWRQAFRDWMTAEPDQGERQASEFITSDSSLFLKHEAEHDEDGHKPKLAKLKDQLEFKIKKNPKQPEETQLAETDDDESTLEDREHEEEQEQEQEQEQENDEAEDRKEEEEEEEHEEQNDEETSKSEDSDDESESAPSKKKNSGGSAKEGFSNLDFLLFTVANGVDKNGWLCEFLEGVIWNDLGSIGKLVVLGWEGAIIEGVKPPVPQLMVREFYLGSKLVLPLAFLKKFNLDKDALVGMIDSMDVLMQEPADIMLKKYKTTLQSPHFVVSTENDCWPPSFGSQYNAIAGQLLARKMIPTDNSLRLAEQSANKLNAETYPFKQQGPRLYKHMNTGGWFGDVEHVKNVLSAAIDDRPEYFTHHLVYGPDGNFVREGNEAAVVSVPPDFLEDWPLDSNNPFINGKTLNANGKVEYRIPGVYRRNDQIIGAMLYFTLNYDMSLDSSSELFQAMHLGESMMKDQLTLRPYPVVRLPAFLQDLFTAEERQTILRNLPDRLFNRGSATFPTFVHYNGPAKDWENRGDFNYAKMIKRAWYKHVKKNIHSKAAGKWQAVVDAIEQQFQDTVVFMDRQMKAKSVSFQSICPALFDSQSFAHLPLF